jgi:hypothetical protein
VNRTHIAEKLVLIIEVVPPSSAVCLSFSGPNQHDIIGDIHKPIALLEHPHPEIIVLKPV